LNCITFSERLFELNQRCADRPVLSEFRAAHARAGNETTGRLYLEHPKFEGFEVRQTITQKAAGA